MTSSFYKLKRHRLVSGVLAGLADKFGLMQGNIDI